MIRALGGDICDMATYPKAPIVEAVIDLRMGGVTDIDAIAKIAEKLNASYPVAEHLNNVDVQLDGDRLDVRQSVGGIRLTSMDQADILLLNPGGITTSRLAPYIDWETLAASAKNNHATWRKIGADSKVVRIGVRYINRLDIPLNDPRTFSPPDYVKLQLKYAEDLPAGRFLTYAAQLRFESTNPLWTIQTNVGSVSPSPLVGHQSLLLDIDVVREREIPDAPSNLWSVIEEARDIKNSIFEAFITDAARETFR